jgi:predicted esterase
MRQGRRTGTLIVAALAAAAATAPAAHAARRADGNLGEWKGAPTQLSGQTTVSRGELIYTDWLYDDYGGDFDHALDEPAFRCEGCLTSGDLRYPSNATRYGYNAADLRELRVAADRSGLHVLIELQTMKAADAAIATLAIDADGSAATSVPRWPDGSGIATKGPERFVTTWGPGARFRGPKGVAPLRSAVNLRKNAIEVDVPYSRLGTIGRKARIWLVVGLNDGHGRFMTPAPGGLLPIGASVPSPPASGVYNVAFRPGEIPTLGRFPESSWGEKQQARELASGDVAPFAHRLELRRLRARASDPPFVPNPGFYTRIFRSRLRFGEGIDRYANQSDVYRAIPGGEKPQFLSPYQPYGLYIPRGWNRKRRSALTLFGHGLGANHVEYRVFTPHLLTQLGDEQHSLIITPLARGTDTEYLDAGFADVLEAMADVRRAYRVDPNRTSIGGYSMGGFMVYRIALLMPDLFNAASAWMGPPAYFYWPYPLPRHTSPKWRTAANMTLVVENARDLPFQMTASQADELVPIGGSNHMADIFRRRGNDYRYYRQLADEHHEHLYADEWSRTRNWLSRYRRVRNPPEVVYKRYPAMDLRDRNLVFDGAYWVDGIVVRNDRAETSHGLVRARSYALGGAIERPRAIKPYSYDEGPPSTPATVTGQVRVPVRRVKRRNGFAATLRNVSALTFATHRMRLRTRRRMTVAVRTDGPVKIRLRGHFRCVRARSRTRPLQVKRSPAAIVLSLRASAHVALTPCR